MKNYLQAGDVMTVTAPADTVGGAPVMIGSLFGIAVHDAKSGDELSIKCGGVYTDLPKATGDTWAMGDPLYWDAGAGKLTETATNNKRVGVAAGAFASNATKGTARIGNLTAI